jgi:hypothetical protein
MEADKVLKPAKEIDAILFQWVGFQSGCDHDRNDASVLPATHPIKG